MKKATLIITLMFLYISSAPAGEFDGIGMKLGYNSSTFTGDDIPSKGVSSQGGLWRPRFTGKKDLRIIPSVFYRTFIKTNPFFHSNL